LTVGRIVGTFRRHVAINDDVSQALHMTYAGDVTPLDAYGLLEENPDSVLIDVRTPAELSYVGLPDLAGIGKQVVAVPWYPQLTGEQLADQLTAAGVKSTDQLLFICRSGVRSAHAAKLATQVGFVRSHNVVHGFEGNLDAAGHRGTLEGWKVNGLPWKQS
jgi:rhodanese-related sulfurtransferase